MMRQAFNNWLNKPKVKFSLQNLHYLHSILVKNVNVTARNHSLLIETVRAISELMIWGDQNDDTFFDVFLEKNMLGTFSELLRHPNANVQLLTQLIQSVSIIVHNITNKTSIYYVLSNKHITEMITHKFDFEGNEELLQYYVSFLKTLSVNLNDESIQFFFYNKERADDKTVMAFPLYQEAIKYYAHPESLIRTAVRALTLNVFNVKDDRVIRFIAEQTAVPFFTVVVNHIKVKCLECNTLLIEPTGMIRKDRVDSMCAEIIDNFYYCHDIFLLQCDALSEILADRLILQLLVPVLITSIREPETPGSTDRLSPPFALYLLGKLFHILNYPLVINSLTTSVVHPPAPIQQPTHEVLRQRAQSLNSSTGLDRSSMRISDADDEDAGQQVAGDEGEVIEEAPGVDTVEGHPSTRGNDGKEGGAESPPLTPSTVDVDVAMKGLHDKGRLSPRSRVYSAPPADIDNAITNTEEMFFDAEDGSAGSTKVGNGQGGKEGEDRGNSSQSMDIDDPADKPRARDGNEGSKQAGTSRREHPPSYRGPRGALLGCLLSSQEAVVACTVFVLHALLKNKAASPDLLASAGFLPRPQVVARRLMEVLTVPPPSPSAMRGGIGQSTAAAGQAAVTSVPAGRDRSMTDVEQIQGPPVTTTAHSSSPSRPSPRSGAAYPVELVGILLRMFQMQSPWRLQTVRLAVGLVYELLDDGNSETSHLIPDHVALVELAHTLAIERLKKARVDISDDEFLDVYHESYRLYCNAPLRALYRDLTHDAAILTMTMGSSNVIWTSMPSDPGAQLRYDFQFFFCINQLRNYTLKLTDNLPSPQLQCDIIVGQKVDASNGDYIACNTLDKNRMVQRYLLTGSRPFLILVEPDTASMHASYARVVLSLMNVKVSIDKRDARVLFVQTREPPAQSYAPFALLHFDDPVRCLAAKQHLEETRYMIRSERLDNLERILGVNPRRRSSGGPPPRLSNYLYY